MSDHEIPTHCETCGTAVRLREPLEPSIAGGKEWRCHRGCTVRNVR